MQPKHSMILVMSLDDVNNNYLNEHITWHHRFTASYWLSERGKVSWKLPPFIDMHSWSNYPWSYPCHIELKCVSTVACSNQAPCVPYLWFIVSSIKFIFKSSLDTFLAISNVSLHPRIKPFASLVSRLLLISSSRGFVRPDRQDILQRWTGQKPSLRASMRSRKGYGKWFTSVEIPEDFCPFQTVQMVLSVIGSISDWTSCFPELTNLNRKSSSLIDFERITLVRRRLRIRIFLLL